MIEFGQPVILEPANQVDAAVIWLHGMMDNPEHWVRALRQECKIPLTWKFVLLRSPKLPITYLGGKTAAAWGDFRETVAVHVGGVDYEAEDCILPEAVAEVHRVIEALQKEDGLNSERIAVFGFSQGAALTAEAVLKYPRTLACQAVLCGWLTPGARLALANSSNCHVPTFIGHSKSDNEVEFGCSQFSQRTLSAAGAAVKFQVVDNVDHIPAAHHFLPEAIQFLAQVLTDTPGQLKQRL